MAPGPHVKVQTDLKVEDILDSYDPDPQFLVDEVDEVDSYGAPELIYYRSQKALGILFRDIDEAEFFAQLKAASRGQEADDSTVVDALWKYVSTETHGAQWEEYEEWALNVREKLVSYLLIDPCYGSS